MRPAASANKRRNGRRFAVLPFGGGERSGAGEPSHVVHIGRASCAHVCHRKLPSGVEDEVGVMQTVAHIMLAVLARPGLPANTPIV